jgi:CheY-like chemotaxis protein
MKSSLEEARQARELATALRPLVLLVDDDARTARQLARLLREDGFDVELTVNGAAAIARLSRGPVPDALVTDLFMPYADGLAVARFARSRRVAMPTVLVTGHAELVNDVFDDVGPAPVVMSKPLDYESLARTLRALLPVVA